MAGMKRIVPAAFFGLTLLAALPVMADVPAEEPLTPPKPRLSEQPQTALEKAASRVARELRSTRS